MGTHEDYDDNLEKKIVVIDKPFDAFVRNNNTLKNPHFLMEKFPRLFETMVGTLPEGVYALSVKDHSENQNV